MSKDLASWLRRRISELQKLANPEEGLSEEAADSAAIIVHDARQRALRAGLPVVAKALECRPGPLALDLAQRLLADALAAMPAAEQPKSPYLDKHHAAKYLGITVKSLYALVLRGRIKPLRGPKNSYRFTVAMLDKYLQCRKQRNANAVLPCRTRRS